MERAWNEIPVRVLDMSTVLKPSDAFALVLEEIEGGHPDSPAGVSPAPPVHARTDAGRDEAGGTGTGERGDFGRQERGLLR